MARELYPTNRGVVLVDVETSYGAGATAMGVDDVVYAEDVAMDKTTDMITRTGVSPERPGFRAVAGLEHATVSLSTECRPKVQPVGAVTDATAPDIDRLLRAAGWVREDDNPTTSQTYVATSGYTIDSAQVRIFETNDDQAGAGAGCTVWDYFGCRFDWSFVWNAGERWMWTFDGAAKNCDMQASTDPWFTTLAGLNYGDDEPLTAKGLTGNGLAETEGDLSTPNTASTRVIFGGGVTGAPLHELAVLSLNVSGNMGMSEQESVTSAGGIGRVNLVPQDPLTIECVVEQSNVASATPPAGDWDPYIYRDTQNPIEVNFTLTQTGTPGNVVSAQVVCYAVITGVSKADSNGRKTWSLTMEAVYPQSASDAGATAEAGEAPGQVFEAGTPASIGLGLVGVTRRGLMAIQFSTT